MKLSISDLLPYLDCNYAGFQRLATKSWSAPGAALRVGTAVHKHMEWILRGRQGEPPLIALGSMEDQQTYEHCISGVANWTPPWEIVHVELPLEAPVVTGQLDLQGRLDAIVKDGKHYWSLQWKTVGRGVNIGNVLEKVRMSPHEIAYHWLVKQTLGIELAGTILGTFKKNLTKAEQSAGTPIFQTWALYRTPEEAESAWVYDIMPLLEQLWDTQIGAQGFVPRNWTSCFGPFGNSPCPLFGHCHNGLTIEAMGLVPLEDRYAQPEA